MARSEDACAETLGRESFPTLLRPNIRKPKSTRRVFRFDVASGADRSDAGQAWPATKDSRPQDGVDFLRPGLEMSVVTHTTTYPLRNANEALADLRAGRFDGAAVLVA
jgi:hypothetical protein